MFTNAALTPSSSEVLAQTLQSAAAAFNSSPELQTEMRSTQGWMNATVGFRSLDGKLAAGIAIEDLPTDADACLVFRTAEDFDAFQTASKDDASRMVLRGRMWIEGTIALYNYTEYWVNLLFAYPAPQRPSTSAPTNFSVIARSSQRTTEPGPDHTTLSQRKGSLSVRLPERAAKGDEALS